MKKTLKITGIVLGSILVILILLPFAFEGKLAEIVKSEANKTIKAKLDFKTLDLSFIRHFPKATIGLEELSITGRGVFEKDTLLAADELSISVNLMSIFGNGGFEVSRILIDKGDIKLKVLKSGEVNWDIMVPDSTKAQEAESPSSFKLKLKEITASKTNFSYTDLQGNMVFSINDLGGNCSGDMVADVTTLALDVEAAEMNFTMDKVPYLHKINTKLKGEIAADLKNSKYTFSHNVCQLNALEAEVQGWFAMPAKGFDMDLKIATPQLSFKQVLSIVPGMFTKDFDSMNASGIVSLSALIKGHYSDSVIPGFDLALKVKDAMFKYPDLPKSVDNIQMDLRVNNPGGKTDFTVVDLRNLSFKLAGNPFAMQANVKTPISNPDFSMKAAGKLNLATIREVYPLEKDTKLNGILTADLFVKGTMKLIDAQKYDQINAAGLLSLANMEYKTSNYPPVHIDQLTLNFTPRFVELAEMKLKFGRTDLSARGKLENFVAYALKNKTLKGTLNLNSQLIDANELMAGQTSNKSQPDTTQMSAFEVPKNIDFSLTANVAKILYGAMDFSQASGKLLVKDGAVLFDNLKMNAFDGSILVNGKYSTAANAKKPDFNFGLSIAEASFVKTFKQLEMAKKLTPMFETCTGNYSVDFNINGQLDDKLSPNLKTMAGKGVLQSKNVTVKENKALTALAKALKNDNLKSATVKDLKISFDIADGRVNTKPFDIKIADAAINLSGSTGLDQTIAYNGKMTLPESAMARLGAPTSNAFFKIGGTFTKPTVSIDMKSTLKEAASKAISQGVNKVLGVNNEAERQAKIAAIRQDAQANADKLIQQADEQAQKLIDQTSNPFAKIAAKKAAEQLKKEAQKKAQSLIDDAEKKAQDVK